MTTSNLCPICHGSGNLVTFSSGLEYWPCPPCGGAGVRVQHGPAVVVIHGRPAKKRKARKVAREFASRPGEGAAAHHPSRTSATAEAA
ncbi:hypothetical protein [Sphingomonas sp. 3-13AW]|uniref:hypothetical protein n=1 Tax=Sphingomonas sp. 3-13AW TaxID=3050450 RepID=UPI003BB590BB